MNMDNKETNDLVQEAGLEETLTAAADLTAEIPEQSTETQEHALEEVVTAYTRKRIRRSRITSSNYPARSH